MILTDEEIKAIDYVSLNQLDYEVFEVDGESVMEFARAVEQAVLDKLAGDVTLIDEGKKLGGVEPVAWMFSVPGISKVDVWPHGGAWKPLVPASALAAAQAKVLELVEVLVDAKYALEGARIWGGMDWTYNPLHPFKYLPVRDKISAAIAKHGGQHDA